MTLETQMSPALWSFWESGRTLTLMPVVMVSSYIVTFTICVYRVLRACYPAYDLLTTMLCNNNFKHCGRKKQIVEFVQAYFVLMSCYVFDTSLFRQQSPGLGFCHGKKVFLPGQWKNW